MKKVQTPAERLQEAMDALVAKAEDNKLERQITVLSTEVGQARALAKQDKELLVEMVLKIEAVTNKPVFTGFTFDSNVELIVALAGTLQYMKGELRDLIPAEYYVVFNDESRTAILDNYGRLPYLAEPTLIEVDGELIDIDPEAGIRAETGMRTDVKALEAHINILAIDLGLLSEYKVQQTQADTAWERAVSKVTKSKTLAQYSDSLSA